MKFLSCIQVDRLTAIQKRLKDSYAWHQALWKAFPDTEIRTFLYRLEARDSDFLLYLLSEKEPIHPEWGTWKTKQISESFLDHSFFRFQLCANPTVKRKQEGRKNGTRTAIYTPDELTAWLQRKGQQGGFTVEDHSLQIEPPINQPFYKNGCKGNHKRVEFRGVLQVTDPERFKTTFNNGIGSAKAFGFGLLVLQPIR